MNDPKSDRELLQLAAKAAGKIYVGWESHEEYLIVETGYVNMTALWNPLEDDGEALRLAFKLHFDIYCNADGAEVDSEIGNVFEDNPADPMAATRRAIVRAAAAIGESK